MENPEVKFDPRDANKFLTVDDLPPEIFLKIIGYLNIDELIAAQCVCRFWRTIAHEKSFWKDYTFVITGTPEDEKKLKVMPALRNIDGYADNDFINIILDHVMNLDKMNCKFNPPISYVQVESLVQRYPKLQSVTLDVCAPDTLQSVEVLQAAENFEELIFHKEIPCNKSLEFCDCSSFFKLISILNMFADCRNFTTLNNLDLHGLIYSGLLQNPSFSEVFTRVLTTKSHQLQSLKVNINSAADVGIINAVNMCSKIQNLCLVISQKYPVSIDISRMPELRSLSMQLLVKDDVFMKSLYYSFSRMSYLKEVDLSIYAFSQYGEYLLKALARSAKQLRILRYWDWENCINDSDLEYFCNMPRLESLSLCFLNNISLKGMTYISHCHNLRILHIVADSTADSTDSIDITNFKPSVADMICPMKELVSLSFTVCEVASIMLNDKEEIKNFISRYLNNEQNPL